jgi:type IV fimbrial biogenesis protein FimT
VKRLRYLRAPLTAGFTLVELMVVVALMAVLLALVAPSVRQLLAAQRVQSINAELVTNLQFARSEAVRRNTNVLVEFASGTNTTCYVVYLPGVVGRCNCLRPPGAACSGNFTEIKTVQVPKRLSVELAASSGVARIVTFQQVTGTSLPGAFQIDVASSVSGALRTTVNITGRPAVCSPDGSVRGVPQCAP